MQYSTIALSLLVAAAHARTDLAGCTSTASGASLIWYVPGTGELCNIIDCGGGRAPGKTTVPGCPMYAGTATVTPSFLPGYGADATTTAATEGTSAAAQDSPSMSIEGVLTEGVSIAPIETPLSSYMSESATSSPSTTLSASTVEVTAVISSTASASTPLITSSTFAGYGNGTITASNAVASTGGLNTTTSGLVPFTGAANVLGSTKEVVGLAFGLVAGLAML